MDSARRPDDAAQVRLLNPDKSELLFELLMIRNGLVCVLFLAALMTHARGQEQFRVPAPLGLDEYFYTPEDNPLTPAKIKLGRRLFFERRISSDRSISCSSCHKPERAFSDGLSIAIGIGGRKGNRSAPALINRAYGRAFFWDGRARTLEEQVLQPIQNPAEMNLSLDQLIARLKADSGYVRSFRRVFGDDISPNRIAQALASFIRTLRSGNSPFDRFQLGARAALSEEARRGLTLFRGKANCTACHTGPNFTDELLHNTGVSWGKGDLGRYAVTARENDRGAFKTPTLRELARTAPYMHDGSILTLEDVIEHYNKGGSDNPHLDPELRPLSLTNEEKRSIVTFLKSLSGAIEHVELK